MQRHPAIDEMDDAAIEEEINNLFAKMEQGIAEMKRQRVQSEAQSKAQWARIDASAKRTEALHEETRKMLKKLELGL